MRNKLAICFALLGFAWSLFGAWIFYCGLADHAMIGILSGFLAIMGFGITGLLAVKISRAPSNRWGWAAIVVCLLAAGLIPASAHIGRVGYARFGFTVYGVTPIPSLDITVSAKGRLGIRSKTHRITAAELRALAEPGVEIIIVGNGWDQVAQVEPAALAIPGVAVVVLPTPEAFKEFNRLRGLGKRVALLAHTTC